MRGKFGLQHVIDLAGGVAAAADFDLDFFRGDQSRRMPLFGAGVAQRDVAGGIGSERKGGGDGEVKSVGYTVENIAASADLRSTIPAEERTEH